MKINLTPEQERIFREELNSGHFSSPEALIDEALSALRTKAESSRRQSSNGEQQQAVREMLAFAEKNRVRLDDVSVKDLIHQGHRL